MIRKCQLSGKVKIYSTVVRPVLMCGSGAWALTKLERTAMKLPRWIIRISLLENLRNEKGEFQVC